MFCCKFVLWSKTDGWVYEIYMVAPPTRYEPNTPLAWIRWKAIQNKFIQSIMAPALWQFDHTFVELTFGNSSCTIRIHDSVVWIDVGWQFWVAILFLQLSQVFVSLKIKHMIQKFGLDSKSHLKNVRVMCLHKKCSQVGVPWIFLNHVHNTAEYDTSCPTEKATTWICKSLDSRRLPAQHWPRKQF